MKTLTYIDLVNRLVDLKMLSLPPQAGEQSGCFSSYDRSSRYNEKTGRYENWDANRDGDGHIRKEGESIVAFECEGPGVIWRVWSAIPKAGHIRVYIDGILEIDLPFINFFTFFGSEDWPDYMKVANFPELARVLSRGHNRYIPIPFNGSCKILLDPGWGAFYHFTYTRFPKEIQLPKYQACFDRDACIALSKADRLLAQRGYLVPADENTQVQRIKVEAPSKQTVKIASISGRRAITRLESSPDPSVSAATLRELALSIRWDGEASPSVWTPLGDFFGTAPGVNRYRSLPVGMTDARFYSNWYMPFASGAEIELTNDGDLPQLLDFVIYHAPTERPADELLRFHAKWHRGAFQDEVQRNGRDIDWPILLSEGTGRFCGVHLHVWNRWQEPDKPVDSWWYGMGAEKNINWWWGEGDEKFFVDGEKFPSTFGTGSEDYIGYAFAAEPPFPVFDSAFASQPYVELDGNGHTSVNRFHLCDNIPFLRSFEACIEKYKPDGWGEGNRCLYDAVAYWYQRPGQSDRYSPVPLEKRYTELPLS